MIYRKTKEKKRIILNEHIDELFNINKYKYGNYICPANETNIKLLQKLGYKEFDYDNLLNYPLLPHQIEAIEFIENRQGCCILNEDQGCLHENTIISVNRGGGTRKYKIKDIYSGFHGLRNKKEYNWDKTIPTYLRSLKNDSFGLHEMKDIKFSGVKKCIKIKTETNKEIILTPDHELLDENFNWKEAIKFNINDKIIINGENICKLCGSNQNLSNNKNTKFYGYCKKCICTKLKKQKYDYYSKRYLAQDGYIYLRGKKYFGHPRYSKSGLLEHIYIMENKINRYIEYRKEEVHHINGIRNDNRIENLKLLSVKEHKKLHCPEKNFKNFTHPNGNEVITIPIVDKIISIENYGYCKTYDIIMKDPYRNFIANGIVVHNCGKTIEIIGYLAKNLNIRPVIIVCPASVKGNWENEIIKFMKTNYSITQLSGTTIHDYIFDYSRGIYIINYDILSAWWKNLIDLHANLIVADEMHYLKNPDTQRTKAFRSLALKIPKRIGLTGTLMTNRPIEIYSPVNIIRPNFLGKKTQFAKKYCDLKKQKIWNKRKKGYIWIWDDKGSSNEKELNTLLKEISIRRTKAEVMKDLPPKIRSIYHIDINNMVEYENAKFDFINWLRKNAGKHAIKKASNALILAQMTTLRRLAGMGKIKNTIEWIDNFLETGNKLVVFSHHKEVLKEISKKYKKISVKIDGSVSSTKRTKYIEEFQNNDNIKIFFGTIDSCGEGINLTAASYMVFIEFPFQPGKLLQTEDRCHRYKQINSVNIYYFVGKNTIDEHIISILNTKYKVFEMVINGKEITDDYKNMLNMDIVGDLKKEFLKGIKSRG